MCERDPSPLESLVHQSVVVGTTVAAAVAAPVPPPTTGSRRRRLWEFDGHAHCPVVGVCLPIAALRRLVDKVLGGQTLADDYELHCGAIADCKLRSPMAEAVQRELDRRCMSAVRQSTKAKTSEALEAWWVEASQGSDLAGAFWATLTHARCSPALEHRVLGEVHMLQHQVGMAGRVDQQRFERLHEENAHHQRNLAAATQRIQQQTEQHSRRSEALQSQIVQLRAQLMGRDTRLAGLADELQALHAAAPALKSRVELARECERQNERNQELQRSLLQAQQEVERQARRVESMAEDLQRREAQARVDEEPHSATAPTLLHDRAVLCVGGRPASVPLYRHVVEGHGGRFLHHDGGEEESVGKLEATLAAADMVICQTACISHNAYWRVKDHCKRHDKRCVFVETPSTARLKRALLSLAPAGDERPCAD